MVGTLGRSSRWSSAIEASIRLRSLYGSFVPYDPNRGYRHRDDAMRGWGRHLRNDPRIGGIRIPIPSASDTPDGWTEARELLSRVETAPEAVLTRQELVALWTRALTWRGKEAEVLSARQKVLEFLLQRLQSEGLLHADYGLTLLNNADLGGAQRHYAIATRIHPELPGLLNDFGVCLHAAGRLQEALAVLGRAVSADPEDDASRLHLGYLQLELGLEEKAVESFLIAETQDESRWPLHRLALGRILDARHQARTGLSPRRRP